MILPFFVVCFKIFRFLQELGYEHLLYKPNKADYALYWKKDCIVVTDMISEAPLSASAPHEICLEKMLVDMYCDKLISSAYSKSEYPEVLKQAMETYHIESTNMMRYARRRGRENEMKKILEEIEDAEAWELHKRIYLTDFYQNTLMELKFYWSCIEVVIEVALKLVMEWRWSEI